MIRGPFFIPVIRNLKKYTQESDLIGVMTVTKKKYGTLVAAGIMFTSGCGEPNLDAGMNRDPWVTTPDGIQPFGDGYPNSGAPCRRLAETELTADWLDHTAVLVGCPGTKKAIAVRTLIEGSGGTVVAEVEGYTVVSVPH